MPRRSADPKERVDSLSHARGLACRVLTTVPAALDQPPQDDAQRRQLNGLREELVRALFDGPHRQLDGAEPGEDHDRERRVRAPELRQQAERGSVRKLVVDHCQVWALSREDVLAFLARPRDLDSETVGREIGLEHPLHSSVVLDDKDLLADGGRRPRVRGYVSAIRFRRSVDLRPARHIRALGIQPHDRLNHAARIHGR